MHRVGRSAFCGPGAATVGRFEGQEELNPLGGGPSDGVNVAAAMGGALIAMETACITQSSARGN
jgi:hypothetical protein